MGNWMTVRIVGTCDPADVPALKKAIELGENYENLHCLSDAAGLAGLPNWARSEFDKTGNLAERGYSVEDVRYTLEQISSTVPSLKCKVHCGGKYENKTCVATVTLEDGKAVVGEPEIETLDAVSYDQMVGQMNWQMLRRAVYKTDRADSEGEILGMAALYGDLAKLSVPIELTYTSAMPKPILKIPVQMVNDPKGVELLRKAVEQWQALQRAKEQPDASQG